MTESSLGREAPTFTNEHPRALVWGTLCMLVKEGFILSCSHLPPPCLSLNRSLVLSAELKPSLWFPWTKLKKTIFMFPRGKTILAPLSLPPWPTHGSPCQDLLLKTKQYKQTNKQILLFKKKDFPGSTLIPISLKQWKKCCPRSQGNGVHRLLWEMDRELGTNIFSPNLTKLDLYPSYYHSGPLRWLMFVK